MFLFWRCSDVLLLATAFFLRSVLLRDDCRVFVLATRWLHLIMVWLCVVENRSALKHILDFAHSRVDLFTLVLSIVVFVLT